MKNMSASKRSDRTVSVLLTGITSITDTSTARVVVVGGITITFTLAEWDFMVTEFTAPSAE